MKALSSLHWKDGQDWKNDKKNSSKPFSTYVLPKLLTSYKIWGSQSSIWTLYYITYLSFVLHNQSDITPSSKRNHDREIYSSLRTQGYDPTAMAMNGLCVSIYWMNQDKPSQVFVKMLLSKSFLLKKVGEEDAGARWYPLFIKIILLETCWRDQQAITINTNWYLEINRHRA